MTLITKPIGYFLDFGEILDGVPLAKFFEEKKKKKKKGLKHEEKGEKESWNPCVKKMKKCWRGKVKSTLGQSVIMGCVWRETQEPGVS
jgi:hypothetical protein